MSTPGVNTHSLNERFLSEKYPPEALQALILPRAVWRPTPTIEDRAAWTGLSEPVQRSLMARGESSLAASWPRLPASLYLQYARSGNRSHFEDAYMGRRDILINETLSECVESQGRCMDGIADALWSICEESSWCFPAHISAQQAGVGLPDTSEPVVDLFAAETSAMLAWVDSLLGARLDAVSPLLRERIRREVRDRILTPCLERDDFWWMGFSDRPVNNWNPWVNSNWLASLLLLEDDPDRRLAGVWKVVESLDRFITPYPQDGGCDEGPSYWGRAGASLFDALELFYSASAGKIDVYSDPKIKEIGRFVYRAHIAGDYYINFADAPARLTPDPMLVFRFGLRIGDEKMIRFGAWLAEEKQVLARGVIEEGDVAPSLGRVLPALFNLAMLAQQTPQPPLERDTWLSQIQVMAARDQAGSNAGFTLAAKGGHNDESHNHNDVGHFIIYRDGQPLIVDAGVETYTRKTFSPQRYEIWTMQSAFHSLPSIDGIMQAPGRQYAAREVEYSASDTAAQLALEIAGAYPPEAGLRRWLRQVSLQRGAGVELVDAWELKKPAQRITLSLLTPCQVNASQPGRIDLGAARLADGWMSAAGQVLYAPGSLRVTSEEIPIDDPQLQSVWGKRLTRILLSLEAPQLKGEIRLRWV